MCYRGRNTASRNQIEQRFGALYENDDIDFPTGEINAFSHPMMPVVTDTRPDLITGMEWGLMPHWAKDKTLQKNTLNCMIETAGNKPSFRDCVGNRCLVIVDGFYEWKHVEVNGKIMKQKYLLTVPGEEIFTFAGIYSWWKGSGTFTILTTNANELMAEIHNSKKRMPVVLRKEEESLWLAHEPLVNYQIRKEIELIATPA